MAREALEEAAYSDCSDARCLVHTVWTSITKPQCPLEKEDRQTSLLIIPNSTLSREQGAASTMNLDKSIWRRKTGVYIYMI
jgi:hypothetical protein